MLFLETLLSFLCGNFFNKLNCTYFVTGIRPFSIMLVNLAFNATRNSRIKPKKC